MKGMTMNSKFKFIAISILILLAIILYNLRGIKMGTPLPPNEPGDNCFVCWGVGKSFGNTTTPRKIGVQLFGLEPGDFWDADDDQLLLTPHCLIQGPGACRWQVSDARFSWELIYFFDKTLLSIIRLSDTKVVFRHESSPICLTFIPNELTDPDDVVAFNGNATVSWSLEGL